MEPEPDGGTTEPDAGGGEDEPDAGGGDEPDAGGGGLGYTPIGIGDPWFFDAKSEMTAFEFAVANGASESHAWSNGEIHILATIPAESATVAMQFTTPWTGSTNESNLSGRVLRSRVRIAGGATADGGVQLFAQSGGWQWMAGEWNGARHARLGRRRAVSADERPGRGQRAALRLAVLRHRRRHDRDHHR